MDEVTAAIGKQTNSRITEQERLVPTAQAFKAREDAGNKAKGHEMTASTPDRLEKRRRSLDRFLQRKRDMAAAGLATPSLYDRGRQELNHFLQRKRDRAAAALAEGHEEYQPPSVFERGRRQMERFLQRKKELAKADGRQRDKFGSKGVDAGFSTVDEGSSYPAEDAGSVASQEGFCSVERTHTQSNWAQGERGAEAASPSREDKRDDDKGGQGISKQ